MYHVDKQMQTSKDMNTLKYLSFGLTGLLVLAMMTATILEKPTEQISSFHRFTAPPSS